MTVTGRGRRIRARVGSRHDMTGGCSLKGTGRETAAGSNTTIDGMQMPIATTVMSPATVADVVMLEVAATGIDHLVTLRSLVTR